MSIDELKLRFGESLMANGARYAAVLLYDGPIDEEKPKQLGPTWVIEFRFDEKGKVADYGISMTGEK